MIRPVVLYKDARGREIICEASEYDEVWAHYPGIVLISRGQAHFADTPKSAPEFADMVPFPRPDGW